MRESNSRWARARPRPLVAPPPLPRDAEPVPVEGRFFVFGVEAAVDLRGCVRCPAIVGRAARRTTVGAERDAKVVDWLGRLC